MNLDQLITQHGLLSDQVTKQEILLILAALQSILVKKIHGAIVEFGCYSGTTSVYISRMLQTLDAERPFHVYDSFVGLPKKTAEDNSPAGEQFKTGELSTNKRDLIHNFRKAHLPLPIIHKAWFDDLTDSDVPTPIALAFLDGDYYKSIKTSLSLIEHKLSPGAIIIIDDYQSEALPGAAKATDEWLKTHAFTNIRIQASLALITI